MLAGCTSGRVASRDEFDILLDLARAFGDRGREREGVGPVGQVEDVVSVQTPHFVVRKLRGEEHITRAGVDAPEKLGERNARSADVGAALERGVEPLALSEVFEHEHPLRRVEVQHLRADAAGVEGAGQLVEARLLEQAFGGGLVLGKPLEGGAGLLHHPGAAVAAHPPHPVDVAVADGLDPGFFSRLEQAGIS
jgi:hypothetical protein